MTSAVTSTASSSFTHPEPSLSTAPVGTAKNQTTIAMLPSIITVPFSFLSLVTRNASIEHSLAVSYDTAYDNFTAPVTSLACSANLTALGFTDLGSLPGFPYVGGSSAVSANGSTGCATCWELSFNGSSVNVLVVDHADEGFNVAKAAMNGLTAGDAKEVGVLMAKAVEVDVSDCGM